MPTFKEHASADMHCSVMIPFKKKRAANPCDYAPIAKALAETCMDAAIYRGKLNVKIRRNLR